MKISRLSHISHLTSSLFYSISISNLPFHSLPFISQSSHPLNIPSPILLQESRIENWNRPGFVPNKQCIRHLFHSFPHISDPISRPSPFIPGDDSSHQVSPEWPDPASTLVPTLRSWPFINVSSSTQSILGYKIHTLSLPSACGAFVLGEERM